MKFILFFSFVLLFTASHLFCQNKPYPQNVTYPNGYKPTNLSHTMAQSEYNTWKSSYLQACGDNYLVLTDYKTKSYAVGFGMLVAAYQGDKDIFDKLYGFYKSKCRAYNNYMMSWHVTCDSIIDKGTATEADIDVAFSLLVAYKQWGGNYLTEALNIIQILRNNITVNCSGTLAICPGYNEQKWGGCNIMGLTNSTPAFFRVFAQVTSDNFWNQIAEDTYIFLNRSEHSTTGLVPGWHNSQGGAVSGYSFNFDYDACRIPWRITLDYLWNGNTKAYNWTNKITKWARRIGTSNIKDGYNLNGTAIGTYNNSSFVGAFAVAAMCNNQALVDTFGLRMSQLAENYWFHNSMRMIQLHILTGNFWKPEFGEVSLEEKLQHKVKIYPNPINNCNYITLEGINDFQFLEIFSHSGAKIMGTTLTTLNKLVLPVENLNKGVYLLKLTDKTGKCVYLKCIK